MILLVFATVFFTVFKVQEARADPTYTVEIAETEEAPAEIADVKSAPRWGFCYSRSTCAELASTFEEAYKDRHLELEKWEAALNDQQQQLRRDTLAGTSAIMAADKLQKSVSQTATKLVRCASEAMEVLHEHTAEPADSVQQ